MQAAAGKCVIPSVWATNAQGCGVTEYITVYIRQPWDFNVKQSCESLWIMLGESEEVEGVLKVNSRILEAHQLKKLDKSEKSLVTAIHAVGKG